MQKTLPGAVTPPAKLTGQCEVIMRFFSRDQQYMMLCAIKKGHNNPNLPTQPLTSEEEQFITEYATSMVTALMQDPECLKAMDAIYEQRWAYRFD